MELILGLAADEPRSGCRRARPMYNSRLPRSRTSATTPTRTRRLILTEKNKRGGLGSLWMEKQNLAKEDTLDDLLFNEIIWKAVKGRTARAPPVRGCVAPCRRQRRMTMTTMMMTMIDL